MDKLQLLALLLLILRLIATGVLLSVLNRQIYYFRTTYTEAPRIRKGLFVLVIASTLTQVIPIIIDTAALFEIYGRSSPHPLGVAYAFSNASLSVITAFGWRYLYGIIEADHIKVIKAKKHTDDVEAENTQLKADK